MTENYDSSYEKDEALFGAKESHLLKQCAELIPDDARVLDLGIGQGRNALPLARRGCHVTGIDTSQVAVDTVTRLAAEVNLPLEAHLQNFMDYEPDRSFDVVLCFGLMQMLNLQECAAGRPPSSLDQAGRGVVPDGLAYGRPLLRYPVQGMGTAQWSHIPLFGR